MIGAVIETSFMLIMGFLILSHAAEFDTAIGAVSKLYTSAVTALQGR